MDSMTEFTTDESAAIQQQNVWRQLLTIPIGAVAMIVAGEGILGEDPRVLGAAILLAGCMLLCWTSIFHETAHQTLFRRTWMNVWGGRILGTLMFVPYSVYRQTHIRHHAYLNRPDDWELWPYADPRTSLWFRRVYIWFDLFLGVFSSAIIYGRIFFHKRSPLTDTALRRTIRYEYLAIVLFWLGVCVINTYTHKWLHDFRGIICPMLVAGILQTTRKLTEHLGMPSFDPLLGTRTILPGNWFTRITSFFNFDIFVHGPHHRHPRITHDQLEPRMREYILADEAKSYPVFSSYREAMLDMLPWLTKPGSGINAGGVFTKSSHHARVVDFASDVVSDDNLRPRETLASTQVSLDGIDDIDLVDKERPLCSPGPYHP